MYLNDPSFHKYLVQEQTSRLEFIKLKKLRKTQQQRVFAGSKTDSRHRSFFAIVRVSLLHLCSASTEAEAVAFLSSVTMTLSKEAESILSGFVTSTFSPRQYNITAYCLTT